MAFNLFGKRKKYPFNKQKKALAVGVYAGPEYFARLNGKKPEEEVLDVYAGPEYFEQPPEEIGRVFEEEDAPLPPEEEERFNTVYAGPEPQPERGNLLIYAGPEFFARRRDQASGKEEGKADGEV